MNRPHTSFHSKIICIIGGMLACFAVILGRLFYLQIVTGETHLRKSQSNYTRTEEIKPYRGDIIDCNGVILATNRPISHITWRGTGNKELTTEQQELVSYLSELLSESSIKTPSAEIIASAERKKHQLILGKDIPLSLVSSLIEHPASHANIIVATDFKRYYPHNRTACHVLGYLNSTETQLSGKMGLEKILEEQLRGHYGTIEKHINSYGAHLNQHERMRAQSGDTIQVTLDIALQKKAERAFGNFYSGALIVMDTFDGSIKALVSKPDFSPALFLESISHEQWQKIITRKPFINRALQACYPPASLFKLVTTSAALEENLIDPEGYWYCNGYMKFGKRRFYCINRSGHGVLSTRESVAHSCNILFFDVGKQISIDTLADYAQRFGLSRKTGFLLPENEGLVPTSSWKQTTLGEPWWPGDTLSAAIGQSYLLATPLQMTRLVASIPTGNLVQPRIVVDQPVHTEPLNIQPKTREYLREAMRMAVSLGTGSMLADLEGLQIEAKTGTAQTASFSKRFLKQENRAHAWFGANIFQENKRPLTLVILVENAGSGQVAASIAKELLKTLC